MHPRSLLLGVLLALALPLGASADQSPNTGMQTGTSFETPVIKGITVTFTDAGGDGVLEAGESAVAAVDVEHSGHLGSVKFAVKAGDHLGAGEYLGISPLTRGERISDTVTRYTSTGITRDLFTSAGTRNAEVDFYPGSATVARECVCVSGCATGGGGGGGGGGCGLGFELAFLLPLLWWRRSRALAAGLVALFLLLAPTADAAPVYECKSTVPVGSPITGTITFQITLDEPSVGSPVVEWSRVDQAACTKPCADQTFSAKLLSGTDYPMEWRVAATNCNADCSNACWGAPLADTDGVATTITDAALADFTTLGPTQLWLCVEDADGDDGAPVRMDFTVNEQTVVAALTGDASCTISGGDCAVDIDFAIDQAATTCPWDSGDGYDAQATGCGSGCTMSAGFDAGVTNSTDATHAYAAACTCTTPGPKTATMPISGCGSSTGYTLTYDYTVLEGTPQPACNDGFDNDGDGDTDFPADAGCSSALSNKEDPACDNGVDDDGDGQTDFGADPGCASGADTNEHHFSLPCDNGLDDDFDGFVDLADPGCETLLSQTEAPQCNDGEDNDADLATDMADGDCANAYDNDESGSTAPACSNTADDDGDTFTDFPADPGCGSALGNFENPACDDGVDNDGDGHIDLADPACGGAASGTTELGGTACNDSVDNDGDTLVDFPGDPGCCDDLSLSESPACDDGADNDGDGLIDQADPGCTGTRPGCDNDETNAVAPTLTISLKPLDAAGNVITSCTDPCVVDRMMVAFDGNWNDAAGIQNLPAYLFVDMNFNTGWEGYTSNPIRCLDGAGNEVECSDTNWARVPLTAGIASGGRVTYSAVGGIDTTYRIHAEIQVFGQYWTARHDVVVKPSGGGPLYGLLNTTAGSMEWNLLDTYTTASAGQRCVSLATTNGIEASFTTSQVGDIVVPGVGTALNCTGETGTTPAQLCCTLDAGLPLGTYAATKTVTNDDVDGNTKTINLSVNVEHDDPQQTTGVEKKFLELRHLASGGSASCSEPMQTSTHNGGNANWAWSGSSFFDFDDSPPETECSNDNLYNAAPFHTMSNPYCNGTLVPQTVGGAFPNNLLPPGHSVDTVFYRFGDGMCGVGGNNIAYERSTGTTHCWRHYRRLEGRINCSFDTKVDNANTPDAIKCPICPGEPNNGPLAGGKCTSQCPATLGQAVDCSADCVDNDGDGRVDESCNEPQTKILSMGGVLYVGGSQVGIFNNQISIGPGNYAAGFPNPGLTTKMVSGWAGKDARGSELNTIDDCKDNFCRVEICTDFTPAGQVKVRYRTTPLPSVLRPTPAAPKSETLVGANTGLPSFVMTTEAVNTGNMDALTQYTVGTQNLKQWFMYAMSARAPNTYDEGWWLGPACEVEGGCATTTNVAPSIASLPTNYSIVSPATTVQVTVAATDDGLPNPPSTLAYAWTSSAVSGANCTFNNAAIANPVVTKTNDGVCNLTVTVSDSALSVQGTTQVERRTYDASGAEQRCVELNNQGAGRCVCNETLDVYVANLAAEASRHWDPANSGNAIECNGELLDGRAVTMVENYTTNPPSMTKPSTIGRPFPVATYNPWIYATSMGAIQHLEADEMYGVANETVCHRVYRTYDAGVYMTSGDTRIKNVQVGNNSAGGPAHINWEHNFDGNRTTETGSAYATTVAGEWGLDGSHYSNSAFQKEAQQGWVRLEVCADHNGNQLTARHIVKYLRTGETTRLTRGPGTGSASSKYNHNWAQMFVQSPEASGITGKRQYMSHQLLARVPYNGSFEIGCAPEIEGAGCN